MLDHRLFLAHAYAVLDPLLVPADLWRDLPTLPLAPRELSGKQTRLAHLVCLNGMAEVQRLELLERASHWERAERTGFFSALIEADVEPGRLQAHLRLLQAIAGPHGQRAMFRGYAPEVFAHLLLILDSRQLCQWHGPIEAWTWRHMDGTWHTHRRGEMVATGRGLGVTTEQWQRLTRIGVVNRLLRKLLMDDPSLSIDVRLFHEADRCVALAYDTLSNDDEADVLALAAQCLTYGSSVIESPAVSMRLHRARREGMTYVSACVDLDPLQLVEHRNPLRPSMSERKHRHVL